MRNAAAFSGRSRERGRVVDERRPLAHARGYIAIIASLVGGVLLHPVAVHADTVALWLFDEQVGVYPSSVLNDAGPDSHFMILGRGAEITTAKDVSSLAGRTVPLVVRMRGSSLYALQFATR